MSKESKNEDDNSLDEGYMGDTDSEFLLCQKERLDQNSPELWPEKIPGMTNFTAKSFFSKVEEKDTSFEISNTLNEQSLDTTDKEIIRELGTLTMIQLMEKYQTLKNQSYQLGLQESKEMTRGRFLNVLGAPSSTSEK